MSMMNSGRLRRGRITALDVRLREDRRAAPVAVMTMSLAPSTASISSHGAALAPPIASAVRAACAIVRLTIVTCCTPCDFMCSAVSLPISPAPMTSDVAALEVAEDLARERDGGEADRHRARAEAGLGPHALADGERRVEQAVEDRPRRLRVGRDGVRFLHLAEDLRLADDERVEAGGDAEQMARDVEVGDVVDVRRDVGGGRRRGTR